MIQVRFTSFPELEDLFGDTAIETSHQEDKWVERATAIAIKFAQMGRRVHVITSSRERLMFALQSWRTGARKVGRSGFLIGPGLLTVNETFDDSVDDLILTEAHALRERPTLVSKRMIAFGFFAPRDHWFYEFARSGVKLIRYPSSVGDRPREDLLEDVETSRELEDFMFFAPKRLRVRTDKKREFLSPRQIDQARASLGPEWESGKVGMPIVSFEPSSLQEAYLNKKKAAIESGAKPRFLLLKYRRGGFTTLEQGISYQLVAETPYANVATIAHTSASTSRIFRIVQLYHQNDPQAPQRVDDASTRLELRNGSLFFIGTAGGRGTVRGDTLLRVHGSEISKWCEGPNQRSLVDDLMAAIRGAASNGEIVLETTPNGREWFCHEYEDAKKGGNDFTPIFLAWFDDPANVARIGTYDPEEIESTLLAEETELIEKHNLRVDQIAWRRQTKKEYKKLFPQEYPEDDVSCFLTSGVCFFDTEIILALIKMIPEPLHFREARGGRFHIWEEPILGEAYVLGADTSEGLPGGDLNGFGILHRDSGRQVAAAHGRFSIREQATIIAEWSQRYNHAVIGVERENHGHAVLAKLSELGINRTLDEGGQLFAFAKGRSGWSTNPTTRPVMLDQLGEAIEEGYMQVRDETLLSECLAFRQQPNGKYEGDPHDDAVMKWAVAWQMRNARRRKPNIL